MTEFIWFFGASGAGKATLTSKTAEGFFKLEHVEKPIVCTESLEFERDQRVLLLEEILNQYALRDGSILIKGQSIDLSTLHIPSHIQEKYPEVKQRIVFVYTKPNLLYKRTMHRRDGYWPNPDHDFKSETAFQISEVEKICDTLRVRPVVVNNSEESPRIMSTTELADLENQN